ncbi:MAG: DUF2975 domain-containing protein [Spirochaetales bacterium]|nr:DUF2975 domain-containing protein [Candidatus Physcosoma equi]
MEKLNKAIIVISKIAEVVVLVGMVVLIGMFLFTIFGADFITETLKADAMQMRVTINGATYEVLDEVGNVHLSAFRFALAAAFSACILVFMVVRNINLIFRTTEGKTWFSKGDTPFQPDNIRMVREIGIFIILMPVLEAVIALLATVFTPYPVLADFEIDITLFFIGLVVLALSQYFAYGMELQNEVDGLV